MPEPGTPDLTGLLLSTRTLETFLQALARSAMRHVGDCEGCGITLERGGRPLTVASAGPTAERLDEKQYGQGDGPCLEALRTGREVSVSDMGAEHRWGDYPAFAVSQGTHSSLSLPLLRRGDTAGALNLYSSRAHGFRDTDLGSLRALAAEARGAIALAQQMADAKEFAADLKAAVLSRTVLDQAVGIVMAQRHQDPEQALAHLREEARRRGVTLQEVCADLVGGYDGDGDGGDGGGDGGDGDGAQPSR